MSLKILLLLLVVIVESYSRVFIIRNLRDPKYYSYRPDAQKKWGWWRYKPLYKSWDYPVYLWPHQFPHVKFEEGLHMHSYYDNKNVQRIHGYSKPWQQNSYYVTKEEPWFPHSNIDFYILGQMFNDEDSVDHESTDKGSSTINPKEWETYATPPPYEKYVHDIPFTSQFRKKK